MTNHLENLRNPEVRKVFAKVVSRAAREGVAHQKWLDGSQYLRARKPYRESPDTPKSSPHICCPLGVVDYYETGGVKFLTCSGPGHYAIRFMSRMIKRGGDALTPAENRLLLLGTQAVVAVADNHSYGGNSVQELRDFFLGGDLPEETVTEFIGNLIGQTVVQNVEVPV